MRLPAAGRLRPTVPSRAGVSGAAAAGPGRARIKEKSSRRGGAAAAATGRAAVCYHMYAILNSNGKAIVFHIDFLMAKRSNFRLHRIHDC